MLSFGAGLCAAQPAPVTPSDFRFSGFGTVGVTDTRAPDGWGFLRSIDQPANLGGFRADTDSRLGLQLNYTPSSQFELVGQLLLTRRDSTATNGDAFEWAFAAYKPTADMTARAGRLNLDQFLLSDYRNVGFGYLFARPPVEFYGSIPSTLDGADFTKVWILPDSQWRAKVFVGQAKIEGITLSPGYGVTVSHETDGLLLRAGLSRARFESVSPGLQPLIAGLNQLAALPVPDVAAQASALSTRLNYRNTSITYATLGASYELREWVWSGELARVSGGPESTVTAGYASMGRRFGAVTVFGIASGATRTGPSVSVPTWGAELAPILGAAVAQQAQTLGTYGAVAANESIDQRTLSLGARWDIQPQLALKLQFDHTGIGANGGDLWAHSSPNAGHANVASLLLDFVF